MGRINSRFHPACQTHRTHISGSDHSLDYNVINGPDWGHSEVVFTYFPVKCFQQMHFSLNIPVCYSSHHRVRYIQLPVSISFCFILSSTAMAFYAATQYHFMLALQVFSPSSYFSDISSPTAYIII